MRRGGNLPCRDLFERLLRNSSNASGVDALMLLENLNGDCTNLYIFDARGGGIVLFGFICGRRKQVSCSIPPGYRWKSSDHPVDQMFGDYTASVGRGIDKLFNVLPNRNGGSYTVIWEDQYLEQVIYRIEDRFGAKVEITEPIYHKRELPSFFTY